MPENHNSTDPVRDLAREQMLPTTMHGTRALVTIRDSRKRPVSSVSNDDRGLMAKLGEKVLNYLHKLAL